MTVVYTLNIPSASTANPSSPFPFPPSSFCLFQRPLGSITVSEAPTILRIHANSTAGDLNGYFVVVNGGETSAPIDVYSSAAALKVG